MAAARTATEHLIGLGHTRIAHITGDPDDELAFTTPLRPPAGYRAAHAAAGLPLDPELTLETASPSAAASSPPTSCCATRDPPTAIFAACDEIGMGAMRALRRAGLRVPR